MYEIMIEKIRDILKAGEFINVEFKECKRELPKNVYETVCAFLNRIGGELLLGVKDNGTVVGIDPEYIGKIRNDFVTSLNNINKFSPTVYLTIDEIEIDGKKILYIYIPESSQVHRCSGKIYDRNEDGDFNITDNTTLVANLYLRKQTGFTENTVYPYVTMSEFRQDLISYARKIATVARQDHPWANMTDEELIKSAGLFKKDWQTGKEGFTLAAILLLAKDDVILSAVPHHRTDAVLRKIDTDRYDDRDLVRTNLIESYKRLVAFAEKHLPDPFYLEGDQRISIRSMVMREVIANSLIHREYMNHFPAKFIIERDRLYIENSNKPHGYGVIS
ncbi:MAG: RNA-binding domain-containing protein, partial [Candidatus Delongbacteria bacterium]